MKSGESFVERLFRCLFETPSLHVPSKQTRSRSKRPYSLPIQEISNLAEDHINNVCRAVQEYKDNSGTTIREVMVKATRCGHLLIRLTVQKPTLEWGKAFQDYMIDRFPNIQCLCYNVAESAARPCKHSPLVFLTDSEYVIETTPNGLSYQIGPDTFSEVNHQVELQ